MKYFNYIRRPILVGLFLCLALLLPPSTVQAQPSPTSIRVLAVGNSHSYCGTEYLYDVLKQCGYEDILVASCHRNNSDLQYNYDSAVNSIPNHTFRYTWDGNWTMVGDYSVQEALEFAPWDYVIFQHKLVAQAIPDAYIREDGANYASLMADYARSRIPNDHVKIGWNMLWAFHDHYTPEFADYFGCDSQALYASAVSAVKEYVYDTGSYDFMVYAGPCIENIYYNSYLKQVLMLGYYAEDGSYNSNRGIHLGGTIGAYTEAMCLAKSLGADISRVRHFQVKAEHREYKKLSPLHLIPIRRAIREAWSDPWRRSWKDADDQTWLKTAQAKPRKPLTYDRVIRHKEKPHPTYRGLIGAVGYRWYKRILASVDFCLPLPL